MPAVICVIHGQDAGREFAVPRATVRIGADARADIRLTDPQLHGLLTLVWKNGTWVVTNGLEYPIYMDGQPFPAGESRVWFDGQPLQPTATTSLLLETRADTAAEPSVVQELTPAEPVIAEWVRYVQYIGVALGLLILLAAGETSGPPVKQSVVDQNYRNAAGSLNSKLLNGFPGRLQNDWLLLAENLQQARHADKAGHDVLALNLYEKCSQLCRVVRQGLEDHGPEADSHRSAVQQVFEFINQRKGALQR